MQLSGSSERGFHQYAYDDKQEAIEKAKRFHKQNLNVCVISSKNHFIVFAPPVSVLHTNEKYVYYNGKEY